MSSRLVLLVAGLLAFSGTGAGCSEPVEPIGFVPAPPPAHPLNLVLVVLDTTRPDFLTPYGGPDSAAPGLEDFAAEATRFEQAYSSSCWTLPAHATMFTGLSPNAHGATQSSRRVDSKLPLLAEILRGAGYATAGFSANPWIGDGDLSRGFRTFEEPVLTKRSWLAGQLDDDEARRSRAVRPIREWLKERKGSEKPFFLFVNLMRAHHPYIPTPDVARELMDLETDELREAVAEFYPELFEGGRARSLMNRHYERENPLDAGEWERISALYRASVRSSDDELKNILRLIDRSTDKEKTLVLIVSDHGESLGEHGHFGHILNLYETSVRVAFLARGPGFEPGAVDSTPVHLADVYTTLLAAAKVAPPEEAAETIGVDLAQARPRNRVLSASLEAPSLQLDPFSEEVLSSGVLDRYRAGASAAIAGRYKLIERSVGLEELYDLATDPSESKPLNPATINPDVLSELRRGIEAARPGMASQVEPTEMDEESLEALRALGYFK